VARRLVFRQCPLQRKLCISKRQHSTPPLCGPAGFAGRSSAEPSGGASSDARVIVTRMRGLRRQILPPARCAALLRRAWRLRAARATPSASAAKSAAWRTRGARSARPLAEGRPRQCHRGDAMRLSGRIT
jgi:hypothetical protein